MDDHQPTKMAQMANATRDLAQACNPAVVQDLSDHTIHKMGERPIPSTTAREFWMKYCDGLEAEPFPTLPSRHHSVRAAGHVEVYMEIAWGQHEIDPTTVARTAWALLQAQYTANDEVMFGALLNKDGASNARSSSTGAVIPTRIQFDREKTVGQAQQMVEAQFARAKTYAHIDQEEIAGYNETTQKACMFQTIVEVRDAASAPNTLCSLDEASEHHGDRPSEIETLPKTALRVTCTIETGSMGLKLVFDDQVLSSAAVQRMAQQYKHILRQLFLSQNQAEPLSTIDWVSATDKADIWRWNANVPATIETCVHHLISGIVQKQPDAPAVFAWDGELTYAEFDALSTLLAKLLVERGVGPRVVVPLAFEKSVWTPVAMLGVMKAGGVSFLLDMSLPPARIAVLLDQVHVSVLVTTTALGTRVSKGAMGNAAKSVRTPSILFIDRLRKVGISTGLSLLQPPNEVKPQDPVYLIFTSGSTGSPKGLQISHSNVASAVKHQQHRFGFNPESRMLDFASYSFDVAWYNFFHTFCAGACLCIPSEEGRRNDLGKFLIESRATIASLTPTLAMTLSESALASLEILELAGEPSSVENLQYLRQFTSVRNLYGPAEATVITVGAFGAPNPRNIGRGLGSCTWIVSDGKLAPVGSVGELWLEGPLVGLGYFEDKENTVTAFVEDPSWLLAGGPSVPKGRHGRLYRTGDMVRYDNDGSIVFLGRKDNQAKIRGQRLQLEEVELYVRQVLCEMVGPHVRRGSLVAEVVTAAGSQPMLTLFVNAVELFNDRSSGDAELQKKLSELTTTIDDRLALLVPTWMIPSLYVAMSSMPLTASEKTDKKRLREIGAEHYLKVTTQDQRNGDHDTAPHDSKEDLEKALAKIWASTLNIPVASVSPTVRFTRLGGDSISAMQIASRCRAANLNVTAAHVLRHKTIREIANRCKSTPTVEPTQNGSHEVVKSQDVPLSPIQRLFLDANPVEYNHFNQSFLLRLRRDIPAWQLQQAVQAVIRRHPILGARFTRDKQGKWSQSVADSHLRSITFESHPSCTTAETERLVQQRQRSFDIRSGPLFAVDLFNNGPENQLILMSAHHLVIDLVSWRVIWHDLEQTLLGRPVPSQPKTSFDEFVVRQKKNSSVKQSQTLPPVVVDTSMFNYWGIKPGHNRTADYMTLRANVRIEALRLDDKGNDGVEQETVDFLLAALASTFLEIFTDRAPPAIYLEGHGREVAGGLEDLDISETVGWFTTLHPLQFPPSMPEDIESGMKIAHDLRRNTPGNGRPWFANRCYGSEAAVGNEPFSEPIEILLNYTGLFQQLESKDAILTQVEGELSKIDLNEVSPAVQRFGLVEVEVGVVQDCFDVVWMVNRGMKHQDQIREWFDSFVARLEHGSKNMAATGDLSNGDHQ